MPRSADPSTKQRLLAAGLDLFYKRGFSSSGVQDIVDAADVPKGSFYNHFESKEALAGAAVDAYWSELRGLVIEVLGDISRSPLERIEALFRKTGESMLAGTISRGCFIGNLGLEMSDVSETIRRPAAAAMAEWTSLIAETLREGQKEGSIRSDRAADDLASLVLNSYEGALLRAKVDRSAKPLDQFFDLVLGSLKA